MLTINGGLSSFKRPKPYTTAATRMCNYCGREFNTKGHASHEKRCKALMTAAVCDKEYEARILLEHETSLAKKGEICLLSKASD